MDNKTTIFLLFLLNFGIGSAQNNQPIHLKECLRIGIEKNYGIQIARNEEEISRNNNTLGNAGFLPSIDLSGGASSTDKKVKRVSEGEEEETFHNVNDKGINAEIGLTWTIFDGMKMQASRSKLRELETIGQLNTRISIEGLMSEIVVAYNNHIFQLQKLRNMEASVNLSKERVRIVKARYQIGAMSHLELKQAQVDLNSDMSKYIAQKEALNHATVNLNKLLTNEPVDAPLTLTDSIISLLPNMDLETLRREVEQSNADLLLAASNRRLTKQELRIIRSEYYPYLRVNAGYGYDKSLSEINSTKETQKLGFDYGVTIGMNLYNGFDTRRKARNSRIGIDNAELAEKNIRLELDALLSSLYLSYTNNLELKEMEQQNLVIAQEYYDTAIDKYKLGSLSGLELREAQVSLLDAEERLLLSEYNIKLCEVSLKQISGKIGEYLEE